MSDSVVWHILPKYCVRTLDKSLTAVCLGSPGRCILITCDIHRSLWLVDGQSVCTESSEELAPGRSSVQNYSQLQLQEKYRTFETLCRQHTIPQGSRKAEYSFSLSNLKFANFIIQNKNNLSGLHRIYTNYLKYYIQYIIKVTYTY